MMVGFTSLGSFSSRFRDLVGETPTQYHDGWAERGEPRIPGCFLFMRGIDGWPGRAASAGEQSGRSIRAGTIPRFAPMITNVSLATVWVTDQDEAKVFYVDTLGFQEHTDITMGDGYRWLTVTDPDHPELELALMKPGPPLDEEDAATFREDARQGLTGCRRSRHRRLRKTHEELAAKGVTFIQEPADRPYGVEAILRDNSGNWLVLVEQKPYSGEDIPH